ncbi:helix-turn-helix transcriptional regulator [Streptomyces bauhiniae]|uniref:helix-turn-helix transcriptional regulator n=1 Tax=Streptomyces bauhiniae TaxID=2340725 RepID=UPI00331D9723
MSDFNAIDALLADARTPAALPPADQRRALRQALHLTRTQVAQALGVSPSTVGGWETGRDPSGELREKYAYFLKGAQGKLRAQHEAPAQHDTPPHPEAGPAALPPAADQDEPPLTPQPCVLCGAPATDEVEGYPQHLHPDDCIHPTPAPTPPRPEALTPQAAASPAPRPEAAPAPQPEAFARPPEATPARTPEPRQDPTPRRRTPRPRNPDLITRAVQDALGTHAGDLHAAAAELQRRAIPDAMALLDATRIGARYDIVGHPPLPDILRKKSAQGADEVWEARPHWTRLDPPPTAGDITALDINGAYLSALKTHLPLGALEYSTGNVHSRRRAGIHLITPPEWDHHPYLPNPLGNREEPGPVWVTEPTLRLLQRLATDPYDPLCDPPVIHESFTSGATEQLFEKFRQALRDAREKAITEEDEVTLEYVKSMYSKFVSTMGESNYNRALYRPDWMHIIRSQAFVNLWLKAYKAHTAGLTVMRVMGTDELHIAGNWQQVFTEGRGVSQVKVKDVYAATDTSHR